MLGFFQDKDSETADCLHFTGTEKERSLLLVRLKSCNCDGAFRSCSVGFRNRSRSRKSRMPLPYGSSGRSRAAETASSADRVSALSNMQELCSPGEGASAVHLVLRLCFG
jgi:hypothetical protein